MEFNKKQTRSLIAFFGDSDRKIDMTISMFRRKYRCSPIRTDVIDALAKQGIIRLSESQPYNYGQQKIDFMIAYESTDGDFLEMKEILNVSESRLVNLCKKYGEKTTNGPNYSLDKKTRSKCESVSSIKLTQSKPWKNGHGHK